MDKLIKATAKDGMVRIFAADTRNLVNEAQRIHNLLPTATALLGRTLTASVMMGSMLKNDKDKMTLILKGEGPVGGCLVTAGKDLKVKGYVYNPNIEIPPKENGKLDVSGLLGANGTLKVIMDMGLREPYVSSIPLVSGEIAEDLAYYYTVSEQLPSAVALGVLVDKDRSILASGGLIIQMMPGHDPLLADLITYRIEEIPPLTTLLNSGKTIEDILNMLFDDMDLKINEVIEPKYICDCTRERVEKVLISMGEKELTDILKDNRREEIHCHFCNRKYTFTPDDIKSLLESIR